jgi:hypothetical protein
MPQTFTVSVSRTGVVVLILVAIPVLTVTVFLVGILAWAGEASDWVVIPTIILMMVTAIGGVLLTLKKWGTPKAEVRMDDAGITIRLLEPSPFYPRSTYVCLWEGIENVSSNIETQHNKRFYQVSFRGPSTMTITLSPPEVVDEHTETPFGDALLSYVAQYNKTHTLQPETLIKRRGFYDTGWARALTILAYTMVAVVAGMKILKPDSVETWRVIQVVTFCTLWLSAYYANRRRRKIGKD